MKKLVFLIYCLFSVTVILQAQASEIGLGVNLKGIPTLGKITAGNNKNPERIIEEPAITFQYYYQVKGWKWGAINSHEDDREGWTLTKPIITVNNNKFTYSGRIGTFPYDMTIAQPNRERLHVNYNVDITFDPALTEERQIFRLATERGILVKIHDKEIEKSLKKGRPGDSSALSFSYKGTQYTLKVNAPGKVKKITYPWLSQKVRAKQTWLCIDLGIGNPDTFTFSFDIQADKPIKTYLDYRTFACKNDQSTWFDVPLDDSSCNLSIGHTVLDAPAGKYGFLIVKGDKFYFQNKKEPVFFSGTTFVHDSKFPEKELAETFAKRIANLGFNIVRMHHLDYHIPGYGIWDRKEMAEGKTGKLDKELMDRMDYFIYCLKKEGVYIHMDGNTVRSFRDNDNVEYHKQLSGGLKGTGYLYNNPVLMKKQKEFYKALWEHYNPYTKMAYKDDPAIVSTAIINENDLFTHGNLKHHYPKPYRNNLMDLWKQWSDKHEFLKKYPTKYVKYNAWNLFKRDTMITYYGIMRDYLHTFNQVRPICGTTWLYKTDVLPILATYRDLDYTADHPYRSNLMNSDELNLYKKGPVHFAYLNYGKRYDKPFMHEEWTSRGFDLAC